MLANTTFARSVLQQTPLTHQIPLDREEQAASCAELGAMKQDKKTTSTRLVRVVLISRTFRLRTCSLYPFRERESGSISYCDVFQITNKKPMGTRRVSSISNYIISPKLALQSFYIANLGVDGLFISCVLHNKYYILYYIMDYVLYIMNYVLYYIMYHIIYIMSIRVSTHLHTGQRFSKSRLTRTFTL